MQLLIMQFSPTSASSCFLSQDIFLRTLFSNNSGLCSSINVTDQVSYPYKKCTIVVLYILIFMFVNNTWEDKIF